MLTKASSLSVEPRIRLYYGGRHAFGPGKADLLEHIERTGSIGKSAEAMGMSYMKAWKLVQSLDRGFREPLVLKSRGGAQRGGATLTSTGKRVLALYRDMEARVAVAVRTPRSQIAACLKVS